MEIKDAVFLLLSILCFVQSSQTAVDFDDPAQYSTPSGLNACHKPWRPVLRIEKGGVIVNGSLEELKAVAMEGHLLRIKLYLPYGAYLLNVENANVHGQHVCAESYWHLSDNGTHISTAAAWRFHLLCTDGQVYVIESEYSRPVNWTTTSNASGLQRENDASANYGAGTNTSEAMLWYAKEKGCDDGRPVYSHYLDGTRHSGSLKDLIYLAKIGETRAVMRDRGYAFVMNNVWVDEAKEIVNGQSIFHVGQQVTEHSLAFRLPPYHWFSSWATTGRRDNARWYVRTNQPRGHNNDYVALDWHVDTCWRAVYTHDNYGYPLAGSKDELIFLISLGHRVRVQFGMTVLEANSIRVSDQTVIAQCLEEMGRRETGSADEAYFFNTETLWRWTTVHTTGSVKMVNYRVRDMSSYQRKSLDVAQIRWMVDTRPWKRIYSYPVNSNLRFFNLLDAVNQGASIRLGLQQDKTAGFLFVNADNVRVDESDEQLGPVVYAQCLRQISDKKDTIKPGEYEIQSEPFHWFLMISSEGAMTMSAWKTSSRVQFYDDVAPEANITWFASL